MLEKQINDRGLRDSGMFVTSWFATIKYCIFKLNARDLHDEEICKLIYIQCIYITVVCTGQCDEEEENIRGARDRINVVFQQKMDRILVICTMQE